MIRTKPTFVALLAFTVAVPAAAQEVEDLPAPWTNMRWGPLQPRNQMLNRAGLQSYKWRQSSRQEEDGSVFYFELWNPNNTSVRAYFDPTRNLRGEMQFRGGEYSGLLYVRNSLDGGDFVPSEFRLGPRQRIRMRFVRAAGETGEPSRGEVFWTLPQDSRTPVAAADDECPDGTCARAMALLFERSVEPHVQEYAAAVAGESGSVTPDVDSVIRAARIVRDSLRAEGVLTLAREMEQARREAEGERLAALREESNRARIDQARPRGEQGSRDQVKSGPTIISEPDQDPDVGITPPPPANPGVPTPVMSDPVRPRAEAGADRRADTDDDAEEGGDGAGAGVETPSQPEEPRELTDGLWTRTNREGDEFLTRMEVFLFAPDGDLKRWDAWYDESVGEFSEERIVEGTWARSASDVFIDILATNEVLDGVLEVATLEIGEALYRSASPDEIAPVMSRRARACLVEGDRAACLVGEGR